MPGARAGVVRCVLIQDRRQEDVCRELGVADLPDWQRHLNELTLLDQVIIKVKSGDVKTPAA